MARFEARRAIWSRKPWKLWYRVTVRRDSLGPLWRISTEAPITEKDFALIYDIA